MEYQLRIDLDPSTGNKSVGQLISPKQWDGISVYQITQANLYVYDGESLLASGSIAGGELTYTDSTSGSLTYQWSTAENTELVAGPKSGYRAIWELNSQARRFDQFFSVVYWKLSNPITEIDILNEKPELVQYKPTYRLIASQSSTGTELYTDQLIQPTGFFDGSIIEFHSGNNDRKSYRVLDWNSIEKKFTLDTALSGTVQKNDRFELKRSFQPEIDSAWTEILTTIQNMIPDFTQEKLRYWLNWWYTWEFVLPPDSEKTGAANINWATDGRDFRQVHLYTALAKICMALTTNGDDAFGLWQKKYETMASTAMSEVRAKIDENMDGFYSAVDGVKGVHTWLEH